MSPDRVSNPGPLTYESGALPIALHGPAQEGAKTKSDKKIRGKGGGGGNPTTLTVSSLLSEF